MQVIGCVRKLFNLTAMALVLQGSHAVADDFRYSGFLNQTLIHTSDYDFFGKTDDSLSDEYREAGLLLIENVSPKFQITGQLLARQAGELDDGHVRVDQLMALYRFQDDFELTQGVWFGRLKAHYGLYNTTRDVPFTRPGILMPQSIYFDRARNTLLIEDTLGYYQERRNDYGAWRLDFGFVGSLPQDKELEDFFAVNSELHGKQGFGKGFQFTWRSPEEQYYVGFAMANPEYKFETGNKNFFNPDGSINFITADGRAQFRNASTFFQYFAPEWIFTLEVSRNDVIFSLESDYPTTWVKSLSYYEQFEYHLNSKWDIFLRNDHFFINKDDKYGKKYIEDPVAKLMGRPSYSQYAIDTTVGVSYRPANDWLIRAEFHSVEGLAWLSYRENQYTESRSKFWNLAALQISYRF